MGWLTKISLVPLLFLIAITYCDAQEPTQRAPVAPPPDPREKPPNGRWIKDRDPSLKTGLAEWLLTGCWDDSGNSCSAAPEPQHAEYPGYDGWYNNLAHPELGAADTPLLRRTPAFYEDSVYKPVSGRPNPFNLSKQLLTGPIGSKSRTGKTALLVFFGQQMVEEILDVQRPGCPPEYFNIPIPEGHEYREHSPYHTEMPFLRSRFDMRTGFSPNNPRQQLNEITPYIDGGLTYGVTKAWADQLRVREDGTLEKDGLLASAGDGGLYPAYNKQRLPMANPPPPAFHERWVKQHETANVNRFFKLGNPRGNENPFLLTFGIVWFRWHNVLAKVLKKNHGNWSDEKIFNEARKWLIATHQSVVMYEWLPSWLGQQLDNYTRYDPSVDPQIDHFFQTSAMRFGHTLVVPGVYMRDYAENGCKVIKEKRVVRTCQFFWRPQEPMLLNVSSSNIRKEGDIDRLLMGMASQLSEAEDHAIVEDLRGRVFGPLEFSRRDLMAVNIQRGRDHGIPDFNTAREAYGLQRYTSENNFTRVNETIKQELKKLYSKEGDTGSEWLNRIDVWIGGILETTDTPGELFSAVIKDQFTRIRNGDRFWFENKFNKLFTADEIERIKSIRLRDILMSVTHMKDEDMQQNPFLAPTQLPARCQDNREFEHGQCTGTSTQTCRHLPPLTDNLVEKCSAPETYDYFSNSEGSYIATFAGLAAVIIGMVGVMFLKIHIKNITSNSPKQRKVDKNVKNLNKHRFYSIHEWVSKKIGYEERILVLNMDAKEIQVCCPTVGNLLHKIPVNSQTKITVLKFSDNLHVMIRAQNLYDLVIKFEALLECIQFLTELDKFLESLGSSSETLLTPIKMMQTETVTRDKRKKSLESFFKSILYQVEKKSQEPGFFKQSPRTKIEASEMNLEITLNEFAEYLTMTSESEFISKMFNLMDKDNNGFVSFREFFELFVIFKKGSVEDKSDLLFDMYDIDQNGELSKEEFISMLKSLLDIAKVEVAESLESVVIAMVKASGLENKKIYTKKDFQRFMTMQGSRISTLNVNVNAEDQKQEEEHSRTRRESIMSIYGDPRQLAAEIKNAKAHKESPQIIKDEHAIPRKQSDDVDEEAPWIKRTFTLLKKSAENSQMHIFWATLYTLVLICIFAERAYYYSVEREHGGLRQIAGYGVTVTRGAASAMMFTYSTLLVTMCRNTITFLRETWLSRFIPFDSAIQMHKYIAMWALAFTIMHAVGHAINFYHIATQTSNDLTCLFRNFFHATHEIPKFHYWCWQTITGVTGILLTIITAMIYIFATPYSRKNLHSWFWNTHNLYPIFYALCILHGAGRLVQEPFFYYFFLGPCVLFILDNLITMSRKKVEIPIVQVQILPSEVTMLRIVKPSNFNYKSGQWVRIALPEFNSSEYHPFTLSSAPSEEHLSLHIRAVGPWTWNLRRMAETLGSSSALPKVYLDGPYGESHQDWYTFDVAVLVGGGIGVTPFASILKDIVYNANIKTKVSGFKCKKVYFFWVTKTQKHFEWLVDIIRELESVDSKLIVSVHIFVTQFYEKFDMRTMLLYICERHFQRASGRSLFTGLKAKTHFGRPNFRKMFLALNEYHANVTNCVAFVDKMI
ncbi:Hypothetical predicted protein [Cloeon dipterum]|uniref:NAD(P)H oxidase (H2O2-forming) n=1 Tax=Cloeon dipterum TaxID=197152 RepID=A0A8S1DR84_9INSE|nr:Hypothetical predicted protein [Cloeon dipterum]